MSVVSNQILRDYRHLPFGNGARGERSLTLTGTRGPTGTGTFPIRQAPASGETVDIIINADDLGANFEVNSEVFDLLTHGHVTSASVLANGPAVRHAFTNMREFQGISWGAHLNVTEFRPLTKNLALSPLLDSTARFNGKIRGVKITDSLREAIFHEWCEQVHFLQENGVEISHLDFHDDVHEIPQLFAVVKRIQKKFAIRKVRIRANVFHPDEKPTWSLRCLKGLWNFALRRYFPTVTTGGLCSFLSFQAAARLHKMQHTTIELMVHPGSKKFREETRMLRQAWQQWMPFPCRLISFHDL